MEEYGARSGAVVDRAETALNDVHILQSQLLLVGEYPLPARAQNLQLRATRGGLDISVAGPEGAWRMAFQPRTFNSWGLARLDTSDGIRPSLPASSCVWSISPTKDAP
jgi:hypothetical protein